MTLVLFFRERPFQFSIKDFNYRTRRVYYEIRLVVSAMTMTMTTASIFIARCRTVARFPIVVAVIRDVIRSVGISTFCGPIAWYVTGPAVTLSIDRVPSVSSIACSHVDWYVMWVVFWKITRITVSALIGYFIYTVFCGKIWIPLGFRVVGFSGFVSRSITSLKNWHVGVFYKSL